MTSPFSNSSGPLPGTVGDGVRLDQIRRLLRAGVITVGQANTLAANPSMSLGPYLELYYTKVLYKRQTKQPIPAGVETPFMFSFQTYLRFTAPVNWGIEENITVLPVSPENVEMSVSNQASKISTVGGGAFSHAVGIDLERITFEGFFPTIESGKELPSYVNSFLPRYGYDGPKRLARNFYLAAQANQPFIFAVTPVDTSGSSVGEPVIGPVEMSILEFSASTRFAHGTDIFFTLTLQRWHLQDASSGIPQNQRHVITKTDTIQKIAQQYLGTAHRWREIISLNQVFFNVNATIPNKLTYNTKTANRKLRDRVGYTLNVPRK